MPHLKQTSPGASRATSLPELSVDGDSVMGTRVPCMYPHTRTYPLTLTHRILEKSQVNFLFSF